MKTRTCYICKIPKPLTKEHFYAKKSDTEGFMWRCKKCDNTRRAKHKPIGYNRAYALKHEYSMTEDQYAGLLEKQENLCAICKKPAMEKERLAIDHNHDTGEVRGLIHRQCNTGIGALKDDPEICENAAKFLRESHTGIFVKMKR